MRRPAGRWMPEAGVSAALSLTRKLSSSRPLSSARIAVITLVVLAGGSGSVEFRSQTTSPVAASMTMAARAVMYGPAACAGAASAATSTSPIPADLISRILHPPRGSAILPTGDYSHVVGRGSSEMWSGVAGRVPGHGDEGKGDAGSTGGNRPGRAHPASPSAPARARSPAPRSGILHRQLEDRRQAAERRVPGDRDQAEAGASARRSPPRAPRGSRRELAHGLLLLEILDDRGAAPAAGLVLDHDEPGVARPLAHPPLAGHVPPEGHHHPAVAHDHDVVPSCAGGHAVERRARARRDLEQRLAARRAPEPVARRVVVARVAQRRVGLAGQLAERLLAQLLLDAHREGEPLGQDGSRLARAQERARHDRDWPVACRDPLRRRTHLGVSGVGERHLGRVREDAVPVALALAVPDEDEPPHQPSWLMRSINCRSRPKFVRLKCSTRRGSAASSGSSSSASAGPCTIAPESRMSAKSCDRRSTSFSGSGRTRRMTSWWPTVREEW